MNVSLVCFTHNDHNLLKQGLLALPEWTLLPREIIVVDDASNEKFLPPAELSEQAALPALRIIRTPHRLGYAGAKNLGLSAATSRFLLSMDADICPCPDWLECCLPLAARSEIGLVSTPIIAACGEHLFGRYMTLTYSFHVGTKGKVGFIPGALWLMRRELWEELGGYDGYNGDAGEDDYLCKQLSRRALGLWIEPTARAFECRPMTRLQMVTRGWKWHGASVYQALTEGRKLDEAVNVLLYSLHHRMLRSRQANPLFLYYDLLYLAYALFDLLQNSRQSSPRLCPAGSPTPSALPKNNLGCHPQPALSSGDYGQVASPHVTTPSRIHSATDVPSSPLPHLLASFQPWLIKFPALGQALTADMAALGFPDAGAFILEKSSLSQHPGLNIAQALAFAFDQSTLNTLEQNMEEILTD